MMQLIDPTYARRERRVMGVDSRHGVTRLRLEFSTISEAVRWFTVDELKAVNPGANFESIIRPFEDLTALTAILQSSGGWRASRDSYEWQLDQHIAAALAEPAAPPANIIEVYMPPRMLVAINHSSGIQFLVRPAA